MERKLPNWMIKSNLEAREKSTPSDQIEHPLLIFPGKIRYVNKSGDCGSIFEILLKRLDAYEKPLLAVGLDLEWPVFRGGQQRTAVIQICPSPQVCYILHVWEWSKLPKVFVDFISHYKVRLVGLNILGDIWKLARDFEISVVDILRHNVVELRNFANEVLGIKSTWSLNNLLLYLLRKSLDKSSSVRLSDWACETLTKTQLTYAATDAYNRVAEQVKKLVSEGGTPSGALLLVEHDPVYTIGLRTQPYTLEEEDRLRKLGAEFFKTDRGGLITFHGPGQLVAYPILNLRQFRPSVKWYVHTIETAVIDLCKHYGLDATTSPHTGVWVGDHKICAIGVHGSRWVTTHGLALNCSTNLGWFEHIVPCGVVGKGVTSLSRELRRTITPQDATSALLRSFSQHFTADFQLHKFTHVDQILDHL